MEHTQGEWESDGLRVWAFGPSGGPIYIASLKFANDTDVGSAEATANTHLIKAAPALLKACEGVITWSVTNSGSYEAAAKGLEQAINKVRAAIKKAKELENGKNP